MKTREELRMHTIHCDKPDQPKGADYVPYHEGFVDGALMAYDWLNEDEHKELRLDDFEKVPSENECEGCYFIDRDHCQNNVLCDEVWVALGSCGTVDESYIFKLKDAKQ